MASRLLSTQWGKWLSFAVGWAALSLLFAPEAYLSFYIRGQPMPWTDALGLTVINSAIALVFVPGIVWLTRRVPIERRKWRKVLLAHIPACLLFSIGHSALYWVACWTWHDIGGTLFYRFHPNLLTYWAVVGFTQALDYLKRNQEHERQMTRLHLELLKTQLQPHFLFNTLHTISAMMHEDVRAADRMISRLSELLRMMLANIGRDEVRLSEELEFLRLYLGIERVRFGERLAVEIDAEPETLDAFVPPLFLQPLVENCIRHGFALRPRDALIVIKAHRQEDRLMLSVKDNGRGVPYSGPVREGLGISISRKRLQQLYPERHAFEIKPVLPTGLEVTAVIPFQTVRGDLRALQETVNDEHPHRYRGRRTVGPLPGQLPAEL